MLFKRLFSQSVAKRILLSFFLSSFILTAISIAVILYSQYSKEKAEVISDTTTLISSRMEFISQVVWNMDTPLAELSIKSLTDNPNITYIAIIDENEKIFTHAGSKRIPFTKLITIPLLHQNQFDKTNLKLGSLTANISTASAQQHVKDNFLNILLVQTLKSIITSAIFLFLIYNILIKHLNTITYGITSDPIEKVNLNDFVSLKRPYRNDELQLLSDTLNRNQLSINKHLRKLEKEKNKLTKEIAFRKVAENKAMNSHEELLYVLNSLTTAVYLCNKNGEVMFMNHKALTLLSQHDSFLSTTENKQYLNQIIRFKKENNIESDYLNIETYVNDSKFISNLDAFYVPNDGEERLTPVELTFIPTKQKSASLEPKFIVVVKDKSNEVKLKEMSHIISHDYLTKIHNRMYLNEKIEEKMAERSGEYSLGIIDLDKFKAVNDTCGHRAGDQLLKLVAETIPKSLGHNDLFARIGGDEFAVLFHSNTSDSKTKSLNIITKLEALDFTFEGNLLPISCSIGITELRKNDNKIGDVMTRADEACYQVKRNGKGSVEIHKSKVMDIQSLRLA